MRAWPNLCLFASCPSSSGRKFSLRTESSSTHLDTPTLHVPHLRMSDFTFPLLGQPATQPQPQLPVTSTAADSGKNEPLTAALHVKTELVTQVKEAEARRLLTAFSTVTHVKADPADTKGAAKQVEYLRSQMHDAGAPLRQSRDITLDELQQHRSSGDAWICIKGKVYDMTRYLKYHPGGAKILLKVAGTDATQLFLKHHAWVDADYILSSSLLGKLQDSKANLGEPEQKPTSSETKLVP